MGSYLTLRKPYEDQKGPYWAILGHWKSVGGPYRTKWGQRDFNRSPKDSIEHP